MTDDVLTATGISVDFGGVQAVDGVTFAVRDAEILGIIGPNGSGKTTLLNALSGVVQARGSLTIEGHRVALGRPEPARRAGLARVYQAPQIIGELSCLDNIVLGSLDRGARGLLAALLGRPLMWRHESLRVSRAYERLTLTGLAEHAMQRADQLSYGQLRLVELARALAGEPRVLLLDEPSAGLNDAETEHLAGLLAEVRAAGTALVVVDHKIDFIDALCDRILVLEQGREVAVGPPDEVWADQRVMDAYLGVRRA